MHIKKYVTEKIIYGNPSQVPIKYDNAFNIGYGIDNNYVQPMGVSMTSIVINNPKKKIIFHVFIDCIDKNNKEKLKQFAIDNKTIIIIYFIDTKIFNDFSYTNHFSKATYNRLLMPQILENVLDKIIYIDADVQCFGKLDEIFTISLANKLAAVVPDIKVVRQRQIAFLQLKNAVYFNAGFMYINIPMWNKENISEKTMKVAFENRDRFNWQDQDALNVVLDGKCMYLDKRYDYLLDLKYKTVSIPENAVFVHYVGRYKPWDKWCLNPLRNKFLDIEKISLWKNTPLSKPNSYKTMKRMGYSNMIYGNYLTGIHWYLKYSFTKIKCLICKSIIRKNIDNI